MSQEAVPEWAQALIERFNRLENTVSNCVMTRLDEIKEEMGTIKEEMGTLAESYDDLRDMRGKVDELWSHFLRGDQEAQGNG